MACVGSTGVVLVLAADTGVGCRAGAVKAGAEVPAETSVHAGAANATFRSCFTSLAVGALGAAANSKQEWLRPVSGTALVVSDKPFAQA